jgi:hypothetical protein
MMRLSLVVGACIGAALAGCGGESSSDLFRTPGSQASTTGGASSGMGGAGAAGFGSGTGGTVTGGVSGFATGGAPSTGGLVGQGGIVLGSGGFAGGIGGRGSGGIVGDGGFVGSGGIVGDGGVANTGGGAGSGGSNDTGGSTGDGGSVGNYASSAAADCNGTPCATASGSACCVIVSNNNGVKTVYGTCTAPGVTCSIPFAVKAFCDGPEDCAHGSVCCGTLGSVPGLYTELACVPEASCTGTGKQIMCHPGRGASCASGVCNKTPTLPESYGVCG